jgi:hypothetical protein
MLCLKKYQWCLIILIVVIIGSNIAGQTQQKPPKKKMIFVRAKDIPKSVQIIGNLGHPLGTLLKIQGKWISPGIYVKDPNLVFHVTLVNGEKPKEKIVLHGLQVKQILSHHKGRGPKPGELWDWRFEWHGSKAAPTRSEGETWEMMGVENGRFDSFSEEAWQEIGGPIEQMPPFMSGFYTYFEFIAVRKLHIQ